MSFGPEQGVEAASTPAMVEARAVVQKLGTTVVRKESLVGETAMVPVASPIGGAAEVVIAGLEEALPLRSQPQRRLGHRCG